MEPSSLARSLLVLPIPAAVVSLEGRVLAASAGMTRLYGQGDITGSFLEELPPVLPAKVLRSLLEEALETGADITLRGLRLETGTSSRFVDLNARSLKLLGDGDVVVITMHGVSDWVRRLEAANLASRNKDEFIALLAHELRNPLAPIQAAIELIEGEERADRGQAGAAAAVIRRQVSSLSRLVDDLMDVARVSRGRIDIDRRSISMKAVVERAIETARPLIEARRHQLRVELPEEDVTVYADEGRMLQVVSNLLTNAAKYTDEGGQVEVVLSVEDDEAVVRVTDDGIGIEPDVLPTIFNTFAQARRARDRSFGGLGLGLALVRGLVEIHGGRVGAESPGAGKGSTFVVRLPRTLSKKRSRKKSRKVTPMPRSRQGLRVLVVDDNVDGAEMLAAALRTRSHRVQTAYAGNEALALYQRFEPQVILLDLGLPDIDGYEVAKRIRNNGKQQPKIVAVTGYGDETSRARCMAAGFDTHMLKPVDLDRLETIFSRTT